MGGVSGSRQGALWPQLCTHSSQLYLYQDCSLAEDKSFLGWLLPPCFEQYKEL